ncbi:AhpC/TSA family protein [Pseudoflavitalea sp. G-6-1-2]|uniref:TlpA disulfide reductase family protein n=1 Tax=Pseudoflavitalea sp. G-6-1-2 TaxID=2728841 RepID=UPI00146A624D|nr:TlpA disulfide reductase family protein [Pseudoflavitalea sp. G-6-1-2]NML23335.1 AhpC/TSA family protein [Pseudoflavitalea sp. G-6-1-2]
MKQKLVMLSLCAAAFSQLHAQEKFTIKGKMAGWKGNTKIFLEYRDGGDGTKDSTIARNGVFELKGSVANPTRATLLAAPMKDDGPMTIEKYMNRDLQEFFLEKGTITVKGAKIKKAIITGGSTQKDLALLQQQLKPLEDKMRPLSEKMQKLKTEKERDELFPQLRAIRLEMNKVEEKFYEDHPDSYVSLDMLESRSAMIDVETFEPQFNHLSDRLRSSAAGKELAERLSIARKSAVGRTAADFTQNNTEGKPFTLSSLRGKYVLLDFWASWCGPCRAENPNVLKAYNRMKGKNFEIVGVSLDDKLANWKKAIADDGLPWIHVSDLKGWKNDVAIEYGVKAVPQNLLIDPNGVIIAKDLRGEELAQKLESLIK